MRSCRCRQATDKPGCRHACPSAAGQVNTGRGRDSNNAPSQVDAAAVHLVDALKPGGCLDADEQGILMPVLCQSPEAAARSGRLHVEIFIF